MSVSSVRETSTAFGITVSSMSQSVSRLIDYKSIFLCQVVSLTCLLICHSDLSLSLHVQPKAIAEEGVQDGEPDGKDPDVHGQDFPVKLPPGSQGCLGQGEGAAAEGEFKGSLHYDGGRGGRGMR